MTEVAAPPSVPLSGGVAAPPSRAATARQLAGVSKEVQTEASFVPSMVDLKCAYEPAASEQFTQLSQLRAMLQRCMQEVAGNVYDVIHFKDIMFKMEEELPTNLPVTDMLLLSSKLFRTTSELGRLLGCFLGVVFADERADEHFHFAEIRILQRELKEVKAQLKDAVEEKFRLQQMLDNVGQVALDHGKAVELLENHNQALQLQTNALEDQMALLFHQLNSDLEANCAEAYRKVTLEMEMQERMNPTRTTFRQTMDSLSQQIRSSRKLISEVRETLMSCSQGSRTGEAYLSVEPSVRFKLKMLDSHFQQLVGRFTSVKDTVVETAHELMTALHERKRILYLSYQHIRLYDLQNAKLRTGKAVLSHLRDYTNDLLQRMQATFPAGTITSVDRIGRITTQRWLGGYTLAALRQRKAAAANQASQSPDEGGEEGAAGGAVVLPGLTEAEMMAAESELAAFEERSGFVGGVGPHASVPTSSPGLLFPSTAGVAKVPLRAAFVLGDGEGESDREPPRRGSEEAPGSSRDRQRSIGGGGGGEAAPAELFEEASNAHAAPFTNLHSLLELVRMIDVDITKLNDALTLEDEMSAFLKTLTLSVTSTARTDIGPDGTAFSSVPGTVSLAKLESDFERALMPTGGLAANRYRGSVDSFIEQEQERDRVSGSEVDPTARSPRQEVTGKHVKAAGNTTTGIGHEGAGEAAAGSKMEQAHAEALLARQAQQLQRKQEQLSKLQDDFSSKLGFLRQVYEARITDLEMKETTLRKKFTVPAAPAASSNILSSPTAGVPGNSPEGNEALLMRPPTGEEAGGSGQGTPRLGALPGGAAAALAPGEKRKKAKTAAAGGAREEAEFAMVRDVNVRRGNDEEMTQLHAKTDRDELLAARGEWRTAKQNVQSSRKMREAAVAEIDRIEAKTEAKKIKKRIDTAKDPRSAA